MLPARLSELSERFSAESPRGEILLLVEPEPPKRAVSAEEALPEVEALRARGLSLREAVREVAARYGLSSKELYRLAVKKGK